MGIIEAANDTLQSPEGISILYRCLAELIFPEGPELPETFAGHITNILIRQKKVINETRKKCIK